MKKNQRISFRTRAASLHPGVFVAASLCFAAMFACGPDDRTTGADDGDDAVRMEEADLELADGLSPAEMAERVDQFAPVTLGFDPSLLDDRQRAVLRRLVEASVILDGIFLRQVWEGNPALRDRLESASGEGMNAARTYFDIMYGPWDRLLEDDPFLAIGHKPLGAGYYAEDLTREEIETWLEANPEDEEAFTSYFTVIQRAGASGESLEAVPYSEHYRAELEGAASLLREAANLADNESLRNYLTTRADAFLSNDYFDSDVAWMRLEDNLIDPTIGPYEVYEDRLFGYKAAFESFLTIRDPAESERLAKLEDYMPDLEAALPIPDEHKNLDRPFIAPIAAVDEVYAAGDTRAGVQTIAFNLPNDPRVREQEGSKKVMLTNVIEAKFENILKPIAEIVLTPEQASEITFDPYFTRILTHELAHALGPDYVTDQPDLTVNRALRDRYSALEEAKADVVGTHSLAVLAERGEYDDVFLRQVYVSHAADLFRCVRFGVSEAHGKGCLMQFNYLSERGALEHDPASGRFQVLLDVMPGAIAELARDFLILQATGDYEGAGAFMARYGEVPDVLAAAIERLEAVPVDIRPSYAVTEMMAEW
jgi:hypothetical protein